MLEIDSTIIYGSNGVCKLIDIREERFSNKKSKYYILKPINNDKSIIYMPADKPELLDKVRQVLSMYEIYELIKTVPEKETIWIDDEKKRSECYKTILESGDHEEIIKVIKTLYTHKHELAKSGKRLHISDEKLMQRAENLIYEEFAFVLKIKREEVINLIEKQIEAAH